MPYSEMLVRGIALRCPFIFFCAHSSAFVFPPASVSGNELAFIQTGVAIRAPNTCIPSHSPARAPSKVRRRPVRLSPLRMDDEVARPGIKEELTTRDDYLATRFTKLSASGHDLTPFTPSEAHEAASHLTVEEKAVLFGGASEAERVAVSRRFRDHSEKGLYACSVGGLPLFASGWKLEPREEDEGPSFAEPCDEEHLLEEFDPEEGVAFVFCARTRLRLGTLISDPRSPSGKRYLITGAALEFHPLGMPLPVRCQPENYWGSEGQYRAWTFG